MEAFRHWGAGAVSRLRGEFAFAITERPAGRTYLARDPLALPSPGRSESGAQGGAIRHAVKPGADGLAAADRGGLLRQREKDRLERVLGGVLVP